MVNITYFDEVTSTNDVAIDLAKKGAAHFSCISALRQTAGRGRRGKIWTTIPNKSIACSVVLRENVNQLLPLVASLAVYDVLSKYVDCSIKWPNDILVNEKKISGILAEKCGTGDHAFYVLGVGINVKKFNIDDLNIIGTSIENEIGSLVSLDTILNDFLSSLSARIVQSQVDFLADYRLRCATIGQAITWVSDDATLKGIAKKVTDSGSLILEVDGYNHEIMSGEIVVQSSKRI
ncbi:MAG: BirA family biotin operon repressor/biotin-[acetyl-CoA-carboxylase] ligase [Alphaproteobacteria bacterium]|jgi:BirA family biotin operon repressor/biotin-[acetyl-CoA-carboxylase] ligase